MCLSISAADYQTAFDMTIFLETLLHSNIDKNQAVLRLDIHDQRAHQTAVYAIIDIDIDLDRQYARKNPGSA